MTDGVVIDDALPDQGGPERPSVRHGLGFAAVSFVFSVGAGLGSSVLTSRLYGVKIIGEYALASAPYIVASQISQVNEGTAFVREASSLPARGARVSGLFRAVFTFSTALTFTMAALVFVVSTLLLGGPVNQSHLIGPAAAILAGYVLVDNVNWNIDSVLSAFRAARPLFWARTAQVVTFLVVGVAAAAFTRSVWGLVVATVASFAVPLVVRLVALRRYVRLRVPKEDMRRAWRDLPAMIRFGIVLTPSILVGGLTGQAGTWMVGATETISATGAYGRAMGLSSKFLDAGYRIAEILLPGMMERRASGDHEGATRLLNRTLRATAVPLLAIGAAAGGAGEGVLRVFGPGFAQAHLVLALLDIYYVFTVLAYVQGQGFIAVGKPRINALQSVAVGVLTLACMWPFARWWGATGVAGAYALWRVVFFVRWDRLLARELNGRRGWLLGVPCMIGIAGTVVAGYGTAWLLLRVSTGIVMTAIALGAGILAAVTVAVVTNVLPPDDRQSIVAAAVTRVRRRPA